MSLSSQIKLSTYLQWQVSMADPNRGNAFAITIGTNGILKPHSDEPVALRTFLVCYGTYLAYFLRFAIKAIVFPVSIPAANNFSISLANFIGITRYWPAAPVAVVVLEMFSSGTRTM